MLTILQTIQKITLITGLFVIKQIRMKISFRFFGRENNFIQMIVKLPTWQPTESYFCARNKKYQFERREKNAIIISGGDFSLLLVLLWHGKSQKDKFYFIIFGESINSSCIEMNCFSCFCQEKATRKQYTLRNLSFHKLLTRAIYTKKLI